MAMGMIATKELALAKRCGTPATAPGEEQERSARPRPAARRAGRPKRRSPRRRRGGLLGNLAWGLGLGRHHGVVSKWSVCRYCGPGQLDLLLLLGLAALLVASFTHAAQFP